MGVFQGSALSIQYAPLDQGGNLIDIKAQLLQHLMVVLARRGNVAV